MLASSVAIFALALIGHGAFWVGIVNRWHSTGFPRFVVKTTTLIPYAALLLLPLACAWHIAHHPPEPGSSASWPWNWATAYVAFAAAIGAIHIPVWAWHRWQHRRNPPSVSLTTARFVDMQVQAQKLLAASPRAKLLQHVPGNQIWNLHVREFEVMLPRLPAALDGLSICHWSDLHFSGRIAPEYFDEVVRLTNELDVDLIALTGDVCDKIKCIDWIEALGGARSRLGRFFVLGNHDLRTHDLTRLRGELQRAGFTDVGNRHTTIADGQILAAGNERPWIRQPNADPPPGNQGLRLLLSHAPDQLSWARRHKFDLMLAGHTHGGQICFPLIGPVICPSVYGVRYAAGFFDRPPTLLHVSRGTSGLMPLRINCPPELTKLVLRSPQRR